MKNFTHLFLFLTLLFAAACANDEISPLSGGDVQSGITAVILNPVSDDVETKALSSDLVFSWGAKDKIDVFGSESGEQMIYGVKPSAEDPKSCVFKVVSFGLVDGPYNSIYPTQGAVDDPESIPVSFTSQVQNGKNNTEHLAAFDYNAAKTEIKSNAGVFAFEHLVSWIRVHLTFTSACTVDAITLSSSSDSFVGDATIDAFTGTLTKKTSTNSLRLAFKEPISVAAGEDIWGYFTLAPTSLSNVEFTVAAENNGEVLYSDKTALTTTFTAGKYKTLNRTFGSGVAMIGSTVYESLEDAIAAAETGNVVRILKAGTYKIPNLPKNITIKGDVAGVVFDCVGSGSIASVPNGATFENATFNFGQSNYHGFQHAGTINMNGCTLNGLLFSYGDMNFDGCIFNQDKAEYMMWAYGKDLAYTDCVFNGMGKFINVYCESNSDVYNVIAEGCEFNSTTTSKSAFNVKETCGTTMLKYNVEISNCTANENFPEAKEDGRLLVIDPLVQVDDRNLSATESGITVTLDGVKVYPVVKPAAKIGDIEYETLAEAVAAAKPGDEIVLCQNVENVGKTYLPAGVTLNGNGYAVSGDSSIEINAEGGAVANVKFQNIHNAGNKLSAVYASNLTGSASVTNCTFDNCDWDAIQMVPQAGAIIKIEGNTFSDDTTDGVQQQRFVHVESAKNVDFSATITENIMTGDTRQGALECYYFTDDAKIILSNNYIEDMADVCVLKASGAFASDMVFPAYVDAEKSATYSPAAMIQTSAYSALFFDTLSEAAAAVTASSNTVKLLADCQNTSMVTFKNDVTIEGNGKTITGSPIDFAGESTTIKNVVFNNGKEPKESASYFRSANVKNVTIDGCTFNDAKWDAMQITSNTLQNVSITNCVFSNQRTGKRYIHIQPSVVLPDAKLIITGNTFNNVTKDYVDDSAVTIYRLMLGNMTIENNTTTGAGAGVLTTDEFWINNGADASDLMSQAAVCKAFGGETPQITPDVIVGTQDELNTEVVKAAKGTRIGISAAGTYKVPALANNVTIVGITDGVVFDCVGSGSIASISNGCTFENVSFNMGTNDYHGFQNAGKITMNGCTINGKFFSYGDMIFDGCTFNQTASDYSMWCYSGNVSYIGCTINCNGKFANVYNEGNGTWTVEAENCIFNSTKANKAALNIKESCVNGRELHFNVVVKNCKATGLWPEPAASDDGTSTLYVGSPIWQVDDRTPSTIANSKNGVGVKVTVDDSVVYGK